VLTYFPAAVPQSANLAPEPRADVGAKASQHYRPDIDGLRAIAVMVVVGYHAFPGLLQGGFVGVDIFFVISGYLITQVILAGLGEGGFSLRVFYRRRVRRIVPALLVVLVVCGVFGWFALLPYEFARLGNSIAWSTSFLANVFFARTSDYFGPVAELSPLLHLWSLGVEEQFYLAWPVFILLASRRRLITPALFAVVLVSLAISIYGAWHSPARYFYLLRSRAWELAAGGMLASCCYAGRDAWAAIPLPGQIVRGLATVASIAGLILIAASALLLHADLAFPGAWALLPSIGATLLIAAGPSAMTNRLILATRPMVFVGRISYPLYLWHWPLLSFARIILGRPAPPAVAACLVITSVLAAYATYRLVEKPIRFGSVGQRAVPGLLVGLAGLALLGAAVQAQRIPARLSGPVFREWQDAASDWHVPIVHESDGSWTLTVPSRRPQNVLFVGDSHIQQYWRRTQRVIQAHPDSARSAVFLTYIGCPPLPDLNSTRRGSSCDTFFKRAMEQAARSDVDTVVFGAFWEAYILGEFSPVRVTRGPDYVYNVRDPLRRPLKLESPGTQLALEEFRSAVSTIVSTGRRVFILLSNPTSARFDPLFLLPVTARLSIRSPNHLIIERDKQIVDVTDFESFVAPLMAKLRSIAVQSGAEIIDPRDALCDKMECQTTNDDGMPAYLDSNHLMPSYAREHAVFIDEILLGPNSSTVRSDMGAGS
jgi:peptidoglycan/LPS O-acetylase OafA/YrhL